MATMSPAFTEKGVTPVITGLDSPSTAEATSNALPSAALLAAGMSLFVSAGTLSKLPGPRWLYRDDVTATPGRLSGEASKAPHGATDAGWGAPS